MRPASRTVVAIVSVVAVLFLTQSLPGYNRADSIGYYAYLRSPILDGDFHFLDEYLAMGMQREFIEVSATGVPANPFAAGAAVLWLPFYLLAHLLLLATSGMGGGLPPTGFGGLYLLSVALATLVYAAAGIGLTVRSWGLATGEGSGRAGIAWAAAAVGTPVAYYALRDPVMPHALSFFAVALALRCHLEGRPGERWWFRTGWALGLAATLRTQNVLFLLWPAWDLLTLLHRGEGRRAAAGSLRTAAGFLAGFAPQMVVWTIVNGGPLTTREGDVSLEWGFPRLTDVLASPYHGVFFWSPVMLLGLLGLLRLRGKPGVAPLLAAAFLAQAVINGLVKVWWGGVSFGHRQFLNTVPGLALGMGAVARRSPGRVALALGAAWSLLLLLGIGRGQVWLGAPMTPRDLVASALGGVAVGAGEWGFWIPSLGLPADLRLASILLLVLAAAAFAGVAALARRVSPWPFAVAAVLSVAIFWGWCGVRTASVAPSLLSRTRAAVVGPGVEAYIASTSKTYDAMYALQRGDLGRAERGLRAAVAAWPADPRPLRLLAEVYRRTDRDRMAAAAERLASRAGR